MPADSARNAAAQATRSGSLCRLSRRRHYCLRQEGQSSVHSRADVYLVQFAACHCERCLGCLCSQHLCTLLLLRTCHLSLEVLETNQITFSRRMKGGRDAGITLLELARVCMFLQEALMTKLPVGRFLQAAEQQQDEARRLSALRTWDTEDRGFSFVVQQELTSSDSGWAFSCSRRCRACS